MAAIYAADIWCDDCAEEIKARICADLWANRTIDECPDGTAVSEFDNREDLDEYLRGMDERNYDSDSYPKYCSDDVESDCPQHCAALADCVNPVIMSDGSKVGYFFGNSLTSDGVDYVKDAVREDIAAGCIDSVAVEIWFEEYDWIDWEDIGYCDICGKLAILTDYYGDEQCEDCTRKGNNIDCES